MRADIRIDPRDIARLTAKLGRLAANTYLLPPMERSLSRLVGFLARYPSKRSQKPPALRGTFVSEKQRRYVMALVREGKVPYKRTVSAGLQGAWTQRIQQSFTGLVGEIGNRKRYAMYVQGAERQALIHRGNWRTDAEAIRANHQAIVRDFRRAIQAILQGFA
jgi:hypothetical protein